MPHSRSVRGPLNIPAMRATYVFILVLGICAAAAGSAAACASCACGDPTLTLLGNEKPFENRIRVSLEYRRRSEKSGIPGISRTEVTEDRFALGSAWAPASWLFVGLSVPLVRKEYVLPNLAEESSFGLGDVELNGKYFFLGDRGRSRRHLAAVLAGIKLPVSREGKSTAGNPLAVEAQPGIGAWAGNMGLWYGYYRYPWSLYATGYVQVSSEGHQAYEPGASVLWTVSGQYQISQKFALQAGFDSRWSAADYQAGTRVPDTGGSIVFASPGLIWSPSESLIVHALVRIPVINGLRGNHSEGVNALGGITYDISI